MAAPVPEGGWSIYDSYTVDPGYQLQLTECWTAAVGAAFVLALPAIVRYVLVQRRSGEGWALAESWSSRGRYTVLRDEVEKPGRARGRPSRWAFARSVCNALTLRPALGLTTGHLAILALIPAFILAALLPQQQLVENPNRLGFITIACIPPLILTASKASPLALVTGSSYERVNFVHRWIGRTMFALGLTHGSLWMSQWASEGILSAQLGTVKPQRGILTLAFLFVLLASSAPVIRRRLYSVFLASHVIGFVGFAVAVCYHTPYAWNWVGYGFVLIYGLDLLVRMARLRVYDATLIAVPGSTGGSTRLQIMGPSAGWRAGQHVHVRAFYPARAPPSKWTQVLAGLRPLQAHPLTISRAPSDVSVVSSEQGFPLVASSNGEGTWSGDLFEAAKRGGRCRVLLDGPYGGLGYETPCSSERVLLLAGGSGASYAVALLDEIVGRTVRRSRGAVTTHCDLAWSVRDYGEISTFGTTLDALITAAERSNALRVRVTIFVTCPCSGPSAALPTRCVVRACPRPSIDALVHEAVTGSPDIRRCRCSVVNCCQSDDALQVPVLEQTGSTEIAPLPSCCRPAQPTCCASDEKRACGCSGKSEGDEEVICSGGCCRPAPTSIAKLDSSCCGGCGLGGDTTATLAGLFVGVCGPASMINDTRTAVASLLIGLASKAGGVKLSTESFAL